MRREFSKSVKLAAFQRANGHCESCGQKIVTVAQYDHAVPDALDGEPTLDNCQVLCGACHRRKTSDLDVPAIAKAVRTNEKLMGLRRRGPAMPGTKRSGWKKKLDGSTERR